MPAATPKPTLEDLLTILSRCSGLRINMLNASDPSGGTAELCFTFKREHLGPAAEFVFSHPSMIFPALKELLEFDDYTEKAYRAGDPRNTIDDVIAYLEQQIQYTRVLNGLSDRMQVAFLSSSLKYLKELKRRRADADRRAQESAEARRKRDEEEIKRKVEEEIRRREQARQQAKEEAHRRWEEEEAQKRKWQEKKANEKAGPYRNPFEDMFRGAGIDPNDPIFEQAFRNFGSGFGRRSYENPFGKGWTDAPPPANGKRKWFEILGCAPGSSKDEIRAAARRASKGLHPDIPGQDTPENQAKIREINEAKAEGLQGASV